LVAESDGLARAAKEFADFGRLQKRGNLESDNPVDTICAEDTEFSLIVAAKIDQTATTPAGARQRHLVDRSNTLPVFIFKQHDRLTRHGCRQA
jgi:hypothetical protein